MRAIVLYLSILRGGQRGLVRLARWGTQMDHVRAILDPAAVMGV